MNRTPPRLQEVVAQLRTQGSERNRKGMAHYGINTRNALGVSMPKLRAIAKTIGKDHDLAAQLWNTGIHEARILAVLVEDPEAATVAQMEAWLAVVDSWDLCDLFCNNLLRKLPWAHQKVLEWSQRPEEFVKRAAFSLMAALAVHDKHADDKLFVEYLFHIRQQATDARNYVKKAVNWALRQIGKRNMTLNQMAISVAHEIAHHDLPAARWIASDALRELRSPAIQKRMKVRGLMQEWFPEEARGLEPL